MAQSPARRTIGLLAVLLTCQAIANFDFTIVNVAMPSIEADLGATGGQLALVVSSYFLSHAVLLVTGARLGDMYGYNRLLLIGLAAFTAASLFAGLAWSAETLIVARAAQGIAAALMLPQILSGIHRNFTGRDRVRAIGLYSVALSGSAALGQVLGGALITADLWGTGWRSIFLINVPIGIVVLIAGRRVLPPDRKREQTRLDMHGMAVLTVAVLLIALPLAVGSGSGWPAWAWACLAASVPALGVFVLVERRVTVTGGYPMVNLGILSGRPVVFGLTTHIVTTVTYVSLLLTLALYLQDGLGKTALYSGMALISWVLAFGVAGPLLPRVPEHLTRYIPATGCLILTGAYLALGAQLVAGIHHDVLLFTTLGVGGFGLGTVASSIIAHLTRSVPPRFAADLSGSMSTILQIAAAGGVAVAGTAYLALSEAGQLRPSMAAFAVICTALAVATLLAALTAHLATQRAPATDGTQGAMTPAADKDDVRLAASPGPGQPDSTPSSR